MEKKRCMALTTIVTLGMDEGSQHWFDAQRERYFPPALNRIGAHVTLFHALPGGRDTRAVLERVAGAQASFTMEMDGLRSMGRGVLYTLSAPPLLRIHRELVEAFQSSLTPQDKQPLRPHVVVQNKVEPAEARALLATLQAGFQRRTVQATGLEWWEYLGGPWRLIERFAFGSAPAA